MNPPPDLIELDAVLLANSAEVHGGMAYVLGGAWSRCWPPEGLAYAYERPISLVLVFRVPWGETNILHNFKIAFVDSDNAPVSPPAEGAFKAGREANLTDGASQLVVATLTAPVRLTAPGLYYVSVEVDGAERKKIQFEAIDRPGTPPRR